MPRINGRQQFNPNAGLPDQAQPVSPLAGLIDSIQAAGRQPAPLSQVVAQNVPTQRQAPLSQAVAQNTGGRGGHNFCPTCGQNVQSSPLSGLVPNINTAGQQAPLAQPVAQNAGGRKMPGKSFESFGRIF
jgi:hypothetical protein